MHWDTTLHVRLLQLLTVGTEGCTMTLEQYAEAVFWFCMSFVATMVGWGMVGVLPP